jgi:nicotinate phosphoribosyltransferase
MPIIQSLIDTDLYKLTMMQCVLHQFPSAMVEYKFACRNQVDLSIYINEIKQEVAHLCTLMFQPDELEFLNSLDYIKSDFIEFLRIFKLNNNFIKITLDKYNQLDITITGP